MLSNISILLLFIICISLPKETQAADNIYKKSIYSIPLTLDPIKMNDTSSLLVSNLLYEGLLRFTPSLGIEGALAESWHSSKDGRILYFKLRENIQFHDGSQINAWDVEYSLKRALTTESLVRKYYDCIEGSEEINGQNNENKIGIKALDARTVEIKLKYAFPAFFNVLAGATAKILPKSMKGQTNFFKNPIGSGPFILQNLDISSKELKFNANKLYYRGTPKIKELWLIEHREKDALQLAKEGIIDDLSNWPLSSTNSIFGFGNKITSPVAATWIIGLNTKTPPLDNLNIRMRFKSDFEEEGFRNKFYPDAYKAFGYIPPGLPGHLKSAATWRNKVLKEIPKNKIRISIPIELEKHAEMKQFIEHVYKKKGWNVEVLPVKWPELMTGYSQKKIQAFLVSMNMDYPDSEFLLRNFESNNPDNFSGLSDKKIDHLLATARKTSDRAKRKIINDEIVKHIEKSSVTINLFHPRANYWISKCIRGFEPNILSDVYIDYSKIEKVTGCTHE